MSVKENPCGKFQANIFNKSKCQNCFQPRESHLLNDEDLRQAKPIYGGWLLLAPEGTHFDNPLHRTRKWQRRFFTLYEHGLLRYALDALGIIDMNRCSDVTDAESRTAQKNSLCVLSPGKERFLRAECKETINGWRQALSVYPRSNKRNQKKKRKMEPPALQEPGPAKVTLTGDGDGIPRLPGSSRGPMGRGTLRQEEKRRIGAAASRGASSLDSACAAQDDGGATSAGRKAPAQSRYFSPEKTESEPSRKPARSSRALGLAPGYASEAKAPISLARPGYSAVASSRTPPDRQANEETPSREGRRAGGRGGAVTSREAFGPEKKPADLGARAQSPGREEVARLFGEERRRLTAIGRFEESPNAGPTDTSGCGEASSDVSDAGKERRVPKASGCAFANLPPAKSPDRRVTGSAAAARPLNVKKGWMTKLDQDGTWKKHWFVLAGQSLRYYKDSLAEEACHADGEIDLSTCSDVQEFPVQRNYGFRILCGGGARTLSAMTSGIRRNWIQAIGENARAAVAPDDARSAPEVNPEGRAPPEPRQGVRPEPSPRPEPPDAVGRSKTSDRSPFQIHPTGEPAKERADAVRRGPSLSATASRRSSPSSSSPSPVPASAPPSPRVSGARPASPIEDDVSRPPNVLLPKSPARPSSPESPRRGRMPVERDVEADTCGAASSAREEIERRWLRVETTPLREEKRVAIGASSENSRADGAPVQRLAALLRKELGQKQKVLEQLQRQNSVFQEQLEDALAREESARHGYVLQSVTAPSSSPQHSHELKRDSRSALESPQRQQVLVRRQIQTLERNPAEARTASDRREARVEDPRSRPASASAEISASERAGARVRDELESERDRSKEQEEERGRTEATPPARRKDGQSRLLWERSRVLGLPEHRAGEIRRLRGRLRQVTARLLATEEGRALTEQRLRKERRRLRESHERERQSLRRRIAEAEAGLLEAKRQLEAPLGRERGERSPKPRRRPTPTSDASESPRESVRRLEDEKGLLAHRCRRLLERTAGADREVGELCARLERQRADYCSLENSYERAARESRRMRRSLRGKEQEILQTQALYRSLLESKEEDLKEALVKMSALANHLEETERKLRAKEDLLSQTARSLAEPLEADAARQNPKARPAAAENREGRQTLTSDGESFGAASRTEDSAADDESRAEQTAATFSDARRHARHRPGDRRSFDRARNQRDFDPAQAPTRAGDSDELISMVRAPETKALAAEEKLKSPTRTGTNEPGGCERAPGMATGTAAHAGALLCVETGRRKVEAFLPGSRDRAGSPLRSLSEVRRQLSRASARGQKTSEEQWPRQTAELSQQEAVPRFAQMLSLEALLLDEMALLVRTSESDLLLQTPTAIREDVENIQSGDDHCLAVVYADVSTRKLMSETAVRRQEPEREAKPRGGVSNEVDARAEAAVNASAVFRALVKAELSSAVRNLKLDYREKLRLLRGELSQRERAPKAIIEASERADWKSHVREAQAHFGLGPATSSAALCPPELAAYAEQIRLQEARDLAEKVVERRLADRMPPGAAKERHRNRVKKLKDDFERQIAQIGRDEAVGWHPAPGQSVAELRPNGSRRRVASSPTEAGERRTVSEGDAAAGLLKDRIRQLEAQMNALREQLENERLEGHVAGLRGKYQRDSESLKATCERGFAAMEESHRKVVEDLQRRHQREISKLTEERERLLAEETAATVAAIEAMKNAHEEELEKNRRSQLSGLDADIDQLRLQYREELRSVQRELEVLSEQYSQKCLENAHLAQALEAERQALGRCRRENRELRAHNQESNGRLSAEIARMRSCLSGETALSPVTPGKDVYELEVLLRVKESEIQYLKGEIHSLKDELQSALRDKKYATDKHKDIYAELSVAKAEADSHIGKLKEKLHMATHASGDGTVWSGYDIMKSKSYPDLTKKEQTTTSEPSASGGSKSLKEGLTVQERTKMFQAKESEKI
ncbi:trichohyalin isoform X2 [Hippocampus zosterae]|uniref:trichohyalin isoform X2 n=1 Tax=Hippocampus zosterae TaxID=109293 RepID=UPI00223CE785|nr:trichohyalin isoform X2 [Hippocampus zosterae]